MLPVALPAPLGCYTDLLVLPEMHHLQASLVEHSQLHVTGCLCSEEEAQVSDLNMQFDALGNNCFYISLFWIGLVLQLYNKLSVFGGSFGGKVAIVLNVCS